MKKRILCITLLFMLMLAACTERVSPSRSDDTKLQQETTTKNEVMMEEEEKGAIRLNVTIGEQTFIADLADNSSVDALVELLKNGALTIDMHDYGNFEKVGAIGQSLPRNDERITTVPGDLILYQGNQLVLYYDTNTWEFTSLGHIPGVTTEELLAVLGEGDVTVRFSLNEDQAAFA